VKAEPEDIVHTERVTGVPLAVIKTPYVEKVGLKVGPLAKWMFAHSRTKHWIRAYYNLRAFQRMKVTAHNGLSTKDYWQAGKSVEGIEGIESISEILGRFRNSL
jgi:nitronate monooxygenase